MDVHSFSMDFHWFSMDFSSVFARFPFKIGDFPLKTCIFGACATSPTTFSRPTRLAEDLKVTGFATGRSVASGSKGSTDFTAQFSNWKAIDSRADHQAYAVYHCIYHCISLYIMIYNDILY